MPIPLWWVGGVSTGQIFHYFYFHFWRKKRDSKHLKLPRSPFKTNLFFSNFGGGGASSARISVAWETQPSKLPGRAIWHFSDDPYHTEFVSWYVEHCQAQPQFQLSLVPAVLGWDSINFNFSPPTPHPPRESTVEDISSLWNHPLLLTSGPVHLSMQHLSV